MSLESNIVVCFIGEVKVLVLRLLEDELMVGERYYKLVEMYLFIIYFFWGSNCN